MEEWLFNLFVLMKFYKFFFLDEVLRYFRSMFLDIILILKFIGKIKV